MFTKNLKTLFKGEDINLCSRKAVVLKYYLGRMWLSVSQLSSCYSLVPAT